MTQGYKSSYQEYLKSDAWKCEESPSGAHCWIAIRIPNNAHNSFQCVHCRKEKRFGNMVKTDH